MNITISSNKRTLGQAAATTGASQIKAAITEKGAANVILATGASQFEMLASLVDERIDWSVVTFFHLDEYIGLPQTHPASFRKYLKGRFSNQVPLKTFYYIDGEVDPNTECDRLNQLMADHPIDVAFVGIGENGHLAFNDPPADFETEVPFMVVDLDEACRKQQFGEGWFPDLASVPGQAISMSIRQIMKSQTIICSVPDQRKAEAAKATIEGPVTPLAPASILQQHPNAFLFLDQESSSLLKK